MKEFWEQRYKEAGFAYGQQPNAFFKEQLEKIERKGTVLLPGEGEGRNAIFAAMQGWQTVALDLSEAAQQKTMSWANELGIDNLEYEVRDLKGISLPEELFDCVGLIYLHLPETLRKEFHKEVQKCLKPDGIIIIEAFHPNQVGKSSGGPKDKNMLYTLYQLQKDFDQCNALIASQEDIQLAEGKYHQGLASVIRLVVEKG